MTQRYNTYKNSGVQWLGEIPEHWGCIKLKKFCQDNKEKNKGNIESCVLSLSYGNIIVKKNVNFGLVPENYDSYQIVNPGNIILRLTDLQNDHKSLRTGLVKNRGIITSAYVGLIVKNMNSEYTQLILHSYDVMKVFYGMGGGLRQSMSYTDIANIYIPVPPPSEQKQIVSYLDAKCGKIDEWVIKKQKEVEHLQELKQRVIADAVTRGLNSDVKMKATDITWLPEVPEHWDMSKISSHFRQRNEKVSDKEYPALSVSKLGVTPQLDNVALSNAEGASRKLVKVGDYAVNSRSDRKGSGGVSKYEGSVSLITIVLEPFDIDGEYVHYLFRSNPWVEEFYRNGRGIVADLWTTNFQMMKSMYMPVPPLEEQKQIVAHIADKTSKIDKLIANITKEIECIKEYKQRLISDVVTGQIKVC